MPESVLKFTRDYWFLILFIGSIVVGWTTFKAQISDLDRRTTVLETKTEVNSSAIAQITVTLGQIQTTLDFIKEQVSKR